MIYNSDLKIKFIRQYTDSLKTAANCENVFLAISRFEEKNNKDLYSFNKEELIEMLESVLGAKTSTQGTRLIIIKEYIKWCDSYERISGVSKEIFELKIPFVEKLKSQTVASPLHLQQYLDIICDNEEENTIDNVYRCYYWMAFSGIDQDRLSEIKNSDVNFDEMYISYNNIKIPIYRESLSALRKCVNSTEFAYHHPNYSKDIMRSRYPGNDILRGIKAPTNIANIRVELSKRGNANAQKTGKRLSWNRVKLSGLFYRTYERELIGIKPDFLSYVQEITKGKIYKSLGRNTQEDKRRDIAREYAEDYKRWKLAYRI